MFSRLQAEMYRITSIGAELQLLKILCLEKWWPRRAIRAGCKVTSVMQRVNRMQWKPERENYFWKEKSQGTGQPNTLGCIPCTGRLKSLIFWDREECPEGKFTLYSLSVSFFSWAFPWCLGNKVLGWMMLSCDWPSVVLLHFEVISSMPQKHLWKSFTQLKNKDQLSGV